MNITIFYFSGTGNTKFVCDKFVEIMESKNSKVNLYNIESTRIDNNILDNTDIIGFAYPVHGADIPKIFKQFIDTIPLNVRKNAFVLSTVGYINAYGPFILKKLLSEYSIYLKWHYVFTAVNNTKNCTVTNELLEESFVKQKQKITKFCDSIIGNNKKIEGIGPWILGGYIVRHYIHHQIENFYKVLYVDKELCKYCYECIRNCPTKSIKYENEQFKFNETCSTCYRCIKNCPVNAIKKGDA